jgi:sphingolipid 8-(E)-desaturase
LDSPSSSNASKRSTSPVSDASEQFVRSRHGVKPISSSGTVSPASSVEYDEADGISYLDSQTMQEISLDLAKYPSLDDATQGNIIKKYRLLDERIKAEGLYDCNYGAYAMEGVRYSMLGGLSFLFLHWGWYVLSAMCLGCLWHQLVFTAHDAGHMGITHNFHVDTVIGIIIADFIGGLSLGWWKRNHNVHHIVTNSPEHDPDIEHMPFFAVSHRFMLSLRSSYYDRLMEYDIFAKFLLPIQSYLYYPIMAFGRFNLYVLSWGFLLGGLGPKKGPAWWHRYLELAGHAFFWTWYGYGVVYSSIPTNWDRFVFVMISHMLQAPLHVQITLSHFAMSTAELGPHESFPQKMLRTTMDVDCPQWLDFFHGGLQFQVVHHLYPRIPRHNLRKVQKLVQEFCNDVNIPYALYGFVNGNQRVVGKLAEVSRHAAILAKCQRTLAARDILHHHHHH